MAAATEPEPPAREDKLAVKKVIVEEAERAGVDPKFMVAVAYIESRLDPLQHSDDSNPYKGLYALANFYKRDWEKHGLKWKNAYDARSQAKMFANLMKANLASMKKAEILQSDIGNIKPDEAGLLYLTHNQGLRGIKTQFLAAAKKQKYTSLPKDIQYNMPANHFGSGKYAPEGMSWKEWAKKMYSMYTEMGEEAIKLGLTTKKRGWKKRAWRKLPEDNPLYKEYSLLANRLTPKQFVDRWTNYANKKYIQAAKVYGKAVAQTSSVNESAFLNQMFNIIEETNNELV